MRHSAFALIGGLMLSAGNICAQSDTLPFSRVELLDDYEPWMDTLKAPGETIELYLYAEQCLDVNGELVAYLERSDNAEICIGSVLDLNPGDSVNLYCWGSATPMEGSAGGDLQLGLYLPANKVSATMEFSTTGGEDIREGSLPFTNGNVDYELVVVRINDLKHEYRLRFSFDSHVISDTGTTTAYPGSDPEEAELRFYPNPVKDHAYFETSKELNSYEIYDINGRKIHRESFPSENHEGFYQLDLGLLSRGTWIIRFLYADQSIRSARILVE